MTLLIAFLSGDLFEGIPSSKTAGKTTFLQWPVKIPLATKNLLENTDGVL